MVAVVVLVVVLATMKFERNDEYIYEIRGIMNDGRRLRQEEVGVVNADVLFNDRVAASACICRSAIMLFALRTYYLYYYQLLTIPLTSYTDI